MFLSKKLISSTNKSLKKLNNLLEKNNINDLIYILGNKKEIFKRNFLAGIFRGIGIGIGVTIITAILIYILQRIVKLNIPVIGEYIIDLLNIIEKNKY